MRLLLVTPPMTQLNTPYPATAYLTGFLRSRGVDVVQDDLAVRLIDRLFSADGLAAVADVAGKVPKRARTPAVRAFLSEKDRYIAAIGPTLRFLQGRDPSLAHRIAGRTWLPEGPRFAAIEAFDGGESGDPLAWAFGALGVVDRARYLATLLLDDLADVVRDAVDDRFEFVRYGERLASSQATFDPLAEALAAAPTLLDRWLAELTGEMLDRHHPDVVGVSAPFSGNVYGGFRIAQAVKARGSIRTILGGGFANTDLRSLTEPRVFDYFDFVCLDDGERPLLSLLDHLAGGRPVDRLRRTYVRGPAGVVRYVAGDEPDVPFAAIGTPTWDGLPLELYLSVLEMLNPMHRLWSDGRWNKLTIAHGCYWKKCAFCDVSLDYIGRYDTAAAELIADRIDAIVAETGQTGFHFVDEAAPPRALGALADALIHRGRPITWWGNIRFEKAFTPKLCERLAESGCVAVTGGLEVASDRLLGLMNKGVTVAQVARVTRAFTDAGVLVHAYLMYGFPTQTVRDTVDALEIVRQLFDAGCIQSGFWHRFACTAHSPVGLNPDKYGIVLEAPPAVSFAHNDVAFHDPTGVDHDRLATGLNTALYNYMHGVGLDADVRSWFPVKVPRPTVPGDLIAQALA